MTVNEPPFERTTCACAQCTKCCKRQPGPLSSRDFERIRVHMQLTPEQAKQFFCASPGALVKDAQGKTHRIGTITPRFDKRKKRCVFLDDHDRCTIHPVAPFGCAYFDTHMTGHSAMPRSLWLAKDQLNPNYQELRNQLPYANTYNPSPYTV